MLKTSTTQIDPTDPIKRPLDNNAVLPTKYELLLRLVRNTDNIQRVMEQQQQQLYHQQQKLYQQQQSQQQQQHLIDINQQMVAIEEFLRNNDNNIRKSSVNYCTQHLLLFPNQQEK